jgi:hypothetical protein
MMFFIYIFCVAAVKVYIPMFVVVELVDHLIILPSYLFHQIRQSISLPGRLIIHARIVRSPNSFIMPFDRLQST